MCRDVNYERYKGCYTSVCTLDPKTNQTSFKVKKAGTRDCCRLNLYEIITFINYDVLNKSVIL